MFRRLAPWGLIGITSLLMLPVLALLASWLGFGAQERDVLVQMAQTVLPQYVLTSVILCVAVALGVALVGTLSACAVTLFEFPGRRVFEWALLLPLAMPAYVVAYAYTDFLQFSGPFQSALRQALGVSGRVFPEVRSTWGAVWVFTFSLYPYVYLLARSALSERASGLMEAARLLGAPLFRRIHEVALPLARPAVAAGVALALMETLADYGVSSYFGIQTFTAGVYKAWLVMDNRWAAAQLATLLLLTVAALLWVEHRAQARMRFVSLRGQHRGEDAQPVRLVGRRACLAMALCGFPVLAGFVFPVVFMLRPLLEGWSELSWSAFGSWAINSLLLAACAAGSATALAMMLAFAQRVSPHWSSHWALRLAGMGYAIPGAVVVVGVLLPLTWVQTLWPEGSALLWITATVGGILWAYLVRFTAVALQSVQSGYARVPNSLDESARLMGVKGWALVVRVHAPLLKRSVAAALLLVFVDVMKELPATLVLRPFNFDTLAVVAYQLARDERLGEAALPALTLVLVGLVPVMLLSRTLRASR